jgi:hypothetical protein
MPRKRDAVDISRNLRRFRFVIFHPVAVVSHAEADVMRDLRSLGRIWIESTHVSLVNPLGNMTLVHSTTPLAGTSRAAPPTRSG